MNTDRILKRISSIVSSALPPEEKIEWLKEQISTVPDSRVDGTSTDVKPPSTQAPAKGLPNDLVLGTVIAKEVGKDLRSLVSASQRHPDILQMYQIGGKLHFSRREVLVYLEKFGRDLGRNFTSQGQLGLPEKERRTRIMYRGGPSMTTGTHEIEAWLTIPSAASKLGIAEMKLREFVDRNQINAHQIGGYTLINVNEASSELSGRHLDVDLTVWQRWVPLSTAAVEVGLDMTTVSMAARRGDIASHVPGGSLRLVNAKEVRERFKNWGGH